MKTTHFIIVGKAGIERGPIEILTKIAAEYGCKAIGKKPAQSVSGISFREEIVGQPIFDKLCGPAYGGEGIVRYETTATYAELSR